jgi:4-hydroxythreonine-4-phosphate dehydrogenase
MLERRGLRTVAVDCSLLRQGVSQFAAQLACFARDGVQAVVCDVEIDDDLRLIAQASLELHAPCFWVGSAGLAAHLAAVLSRAAPTPAKFETRGAILAVVGSLSSVSRQQADRLHAATGIARVDVAAGVLRQGAAHAHWTELRQMLGAALAQQRDLLLTIGMEEEAVDMADGLHLCQALAGLVAPLAGGVGALISTGGETSRALLCAMGYHSLHMAGEIEAGVPLSAAAGPRPLAVITKAGAFGNSETLLNCYQLLAEARGSAAPCLPTSMKGE